MSTLTLIIPFPAWNLIFRLVEIRAALVACDESFGVLPWFDNPRRITVRDQVPREDGEEEFDDVVIVRLWWPGGQYLTARLGGTGDGYGMSWHLVHLDLRWQRWTGVKREPVKISFGESLARRLDWIARDYFDSSAVRLNIPMVQRVQRHLGTLRFLLRELRKI